MLGEALPGSLSIDVYAEAGVAIGPQQVGRGARAGQEPAIWLDVRPLLQTCPNGVLRLAVGPTSLPVTGRCDIRDMC